MRRDRISADYQAALATFAMLPGHVVAACHVSPVYIGATIARVGTKSPAWRVFRVQTGSRVIPFAMFV